MLYRKEHKTCTEFISVGKYQEANIRRTVADNLTVICHGFPVVVDDSFIRDE